MFFSQKMFFTAVITAQDNLDVEIKTSALGNVFNNVFNYRHCARQTLFQKVFGTGRNISISHV